MINKFSEKRNCIVEKLGIIPYVQAWDYQRSLVQQRHLDSTLLDHLLLMEHPPVYTLGTGSDANFLKFKPEETGWTVYRTERGGEVTYHCPGQIVGYPILNLRYYQMDLHWYLRQLEAVIIEVLAQYHLKGERIDGLTGVWLEGVKVAAVGIKVSRWITLHGFALNVCPNLDGFRYIIPCGIVDKPVGSLQQFLPEINLEKVYEDIIEAFSVVFQVQCIFEDE